MLACTCPNLCTVCDIEWAHTCALSILCEATYYSASLDEVSAQQDREDARHEASLNS
jgi:hypothetical protein